MTPESAPPTAECWTTDMQPGPVLGSRARRILHVIYSLSPRDGGPPEAVRQLARNYLELGIDVEVLTLDAPAAPYLGDAPCPVHAVGPPPLHYGISRPLVAWLKRNVRRFDLVVINGVWLFHSVAAWRAAMDAGVPYLVFTHGALDVFFKKRYPIKHLKKLVYWPLQYRILRQARAVLFTSEAERDLALASFQPNRWTSVVLPYGTNKPSGDPEQQREAFYRLLPALRSTRFLLFLGRIHQKKGCDLLLEAFARTAELAPEVHLVMAGPDQVGLEPVLREQARALGIAARVHWPGMLAGDAKCGAFYAAEAFVLPSHQENFGIAVAEALACGRPVLLSDQVNIWREIVADGAGLAEPDTLRGVEQLLRRWFRMTAEEQRAMAARSEGTFDTRYCLRRAAEAICRLMEEALAEHSAAVTMRGGETRMLPQEP